VVGLIWITAAVFVAVTGHPHEHRSAHPASSNRGLHAVTGTAGGHAAGKGRDAVEDGAGTGAVRATGQTAPIRFTVTDSLDTGTGADVRIEEIATLIIDQEVTVTLHPTRNYPVDSQPATVSSAGSHGYELRCRTVWRDSRTGEQIFGDARGAGQVRLANGIRLLVTSVRGPGSRSTVTLDTARP